MPVDPAHPDVLALRSTLITTKGRMRLIAQRIDKLKPQLEAFGAAPPVVSKDVLQMHLTQYRVMFADASLLVEQANAKLCEAHDGLWAICKDCDIPHEPPKPDPAPSPEGGGR